MARQPQAINSVPNADAGSERKTLDEDEQLQKLKDQLSTLADRAIPMLLDGVAKTSGTEGAKVTFAAAYKTGGPSSKKRLEVTATVSIPMGGFSTEVAVVVGADGAENQIQMFDDH